MAETRKAYQRRLKEGFFGKYTDGKSVIDIGCGRIDTHDGLDIICPHAIGWDKDNGDATLMNDVLDESFDTIYSSHIIEHLNDPITAIQNWFRILKSGGHLIISAPSRDHYEKKKLLPSKWNEDHKYFISFDRTEPPCTFSLLSIVETALRDIRAKYLVQKYALETTGFTITHPDIHSDGEISAEIIIKKL